MKWLLEGPCGSLLYLILSKKEVKAVDILLGEKVLMDIYQRFGVKNEESGTSW